MAAITHHITKLFLLALKGGRKNTLVDTLKCDSHLCLTHFFVIFFSNIFHVCVQDNSLSHIF